MEYHCELVIKNVFHVSFTSDYTNTAVIRLTTSCILTTFLFYRLFDNILMKTYSLFGRRIGNQDMWSIVKGTFC